MQSLRIAILWIIGIILGVFALTVGLGWLRFGYIDWSVVIIMGLMLIPVLGVAVGVLIWTAVHDAAEERALQRKNAPATQPAPRTTPATQPVVLPIHPTGHHS